MPSSNPLLDEYLKPLLVGNRTACRALISAQLSKTSDPKTLYKDLLWPVMEKVEKLYRADRINAASEHMATRINRAIADQIQVRLSYMEPNGKRMIVLCADGEPEELGAQMCSDLFEARGWAVYFIGGGVPNDEVLTLVGQLRPQVLLIFGTRPSGVPGVRRLIDLIREIGVAPTMNIMVSGGVFNRADGLWKEVNADLFARTAHEAIPTAENAAPCKRVVRPPGTPKKRRRRRRPPLLAEANSGR